MRRAGDHRNVAALLQGREQLERSESAARDQHRIGAGCVSRTPAQNFNSPSCVTRSTSSTFLDAEAFHTEHFEARLFEKDPQAPVDLIIVRGGGDYLFAPTARSPSTTPVLMVVTGSPVDFLSVSVRRSLNAAPL